MSGGTIIGMIRRFRAHATSLNRWRKTAGLLQGVRWSLVKLSIKLGLVKPDQMDSAAKAGSIPSNRALGRRKRHERV
jgi:hypothetical protein